MRKPSLLLGLLLGLGSLSAHAGLLFATPVASASISGKTVDSSTGKPLAGVRLSLRNNWGQTTVFFRPQFPQVLGTHKY